jgi:hypothetical protein
LSSAWLSFGNPAICFKTGESCGVFVVVGIGVTHASFAAEVQSEPPQLVRTIGLFCTSARTKTQEPQGEESRHLVEALGRGQSV